MLLAPPSLSVTPMKEGYTVDQCTEPTHAQQVQSATETPLLGVPANNPTAPVHTLDPISRAILDAHRAAQEGRQLTASEQNALIRARMVWDELTA